MSQKVIILGGGVGGLSAAHELIERGFAVEVFESLAIAGGKARSIPLPGTGMDGRRDLPGEHGFRFFPRFYRHVTDTMRRIPVGTGGCVADHLIDTSRCQFARFGRRPIEVPTRAPRTIEDIRAVLDDAGKILGGDLGLSPAELTLFASKIWRVVTSCHERRLGEYEKIAWWDFIEAERCSPAYQKLLGHSFTRSLVAAKARHASAKTVGDMCVQILFDVVTPGPSTDRVLDGPTNDVWMDPWLAYLVARGVNYQFNSKVTAVEFDGQRIRSATVDCDGKTRRVEGDVFIFAMPIEDVIDVITPEMVAADPALGHLFTLDDITEWMNGIQIYLKKDVPITHGHTVYVDSPWALTSISQAQFWRDVDLSAFGDGRVKGIISVDISEWSEKGLNGKAAKDCTREEIKVEVWEQLKRSLNFGDSITLDDGDLHHWGLDPAIQRGADGRTDNEEPLLVNLVDTWRLRPDAVTRIPNLFLAADYVRTYTDLATMEAANEAARRAVNGILDASASSAERCGIWPLHEPDIFTPWRELDRIRYRYGLPWDDAFVTIGLSAQALATAALAAMEQGLQRHDIYADPAAPFHLVREEIDALVGSAGQPSLTGEFRREALSLLERVVRICAARAAEAQSGGDRVAPAALDNSASRLPHGPARAVAPRPNARTVYIIPR